MSTSLAFYPVGQRRLTLFDCYLFVVTCLLLLIIAMTMISFSMSTFIMGKLIVVLRLELDTYMPTCRERVSWLGFSSFRRLFDSCGCGD